MKSAIGPGMELVASAIAKKTGKTPKINMAMARKGTMKKRVLKPAMQP